MNDAIAKYFFGPIAQLPEVKKLIVQRSSAARFGAGAIQIIVRIAVQDAQSEGVCVFQKGECRRAIPDKGRENISIHFAVIKRAEIGQCVCGAVFQSCRFHMRIVRHPDNATRNRSRSSQPLILFDDCDFCTVAVRRQSGRQACGSRSDDQYVCLFGNINLRHWLKSAGYKKALASHPIRGG